MNKNQLTILIALVAAVGLAGLLLYQRQQAAWAGGTNTPAKVFSDLPVGESLARIVIRHGTNEVNLLKQSDVWRVKERGDYPANYSEISRVMLKLRELKPVETEQVGPSQLGRLELLPPGPGSNTATLVEFHDASGKVLDSLLAGKEQMGDSPAAAPYGAQGGSYPIGRWIKTGDSKDSVSLVGDALGELTSQPEAWLSKDFFKVEKIQSLSVSFPEATNSWSISRTNESANDWTLADAKPGEVLDSSKTSGFGWALTSPTFNDVVVDPKFEALGLDKPTTITVKDFDGFTYTLQVGKKEGDARPLTVKVAADLPGERVAGKDEKPADKERLDKEFKANLARQQEKLARDESFKNWAYLVPDYTLDSLLKHRSELLKEEKPAEATKTGESIPDEPKADAN